MLPLNILLKITTIIYESYSPRVMASLDPNNFLGILYEFPNQIREAAKLGDRIKLPEGINKIVVAGVGGSALSGLLLQSLLAEEKIPVYVARDYKLPSTVDENTVVFAISYSGNTEEAILMYSDALKKNAQVVVISSGGKLRYYAMEADAKQILIPSGLPQKAAIAYMFFPMLNVLQNNKIIKPKLQEIEGLVNALKPILIKDKAKELSEKLVGKIPLIYTSTNFSPVGYIWKIFFNENAKIHAFHNVFPELNHNEINAYEHMNGDYHVIIIKDQLDHPKIQRRMCIMKDMLHEIKIPVTDMMMKGKFLMTKMFTSIYLAMFTSYFLALRNNIDPYPIHMIEDFKKRLGSH